MAQEVIPAPSFDAPLPDIFIDMAGKGENAVPKDTFANAQIALRLLGIKLQHDTFRNQYLIDGSQFATATDKAGEVSDAVCRVLRTVIRMQYSFEPSEANIVNAAKATAERNPLHPIKSYLESLKWDGVPRINKFFSEYMGAEDNDYTRAVARITFIASVRRIYQPGVKFDYLPILQGVEGLNKSTALKVLYGEENHTDVSILGLRSKEVEEIGLGMWCVECAELANLKRAELEIVKAQLSRTKERARRPYDRLAINSYRTFIPWGTTNEEQFIRPSTGENRRFLPITVKGIDLARIEADRDQLWAEAMTIEQTGESCMLPETIWTSAREERQAFTQYDPWQDALADIVSAASDAQHTEDMSARKANREPKSIYAVRGDEERLASFYVLDQLTITMEKRSADLGKRAAGVMRSLGWEGPRMVRIKGTSPVNGYRRPVRPEPQPWD